MNVLYERDVTVRLAGERVAVLGYGSQGRAQALNLRDSGVDVRVGVRPKGASWRIAIADEFHPLSIGDAVEGASVVQVLLPDTVQPTVFEASVRDHLADGMLLLFSHGFNIHYGYIRPPLNVDVALVAPKAPGPSVRTAYERRGGVPALLAIHQDATGNARERALAYAQAVGCARAGVVLTTFGEETESDLFGEQAVLCGGVTSLVKAGFDTLVDAGYAPEIAYFECVHELKMIVDLIHTKGLAGMRAAVSDTARYGDLTRGPLVIDQHVRIRMRELLTRIQDGSFAEEWRRESAAGQPRMQAAASRESDLLIEHVGRALRSALLAETENSQ